MRVLTGFASAVTNASGVPGALDVVPHAAVVIDEGRIQWVGPESTIPNEYRTADVEHFSGMTALPGFVDAHTHLVFGGDRAAEFGMRMEGATYEEILAAGGGIHSTVTATRASDADDLLTQATARARRMLASGTTTVEVKSGYGLDLPTERRMLEVAARVGEVVPIDVVPTFLAHTVPAGVERTEYLDRLVGEILPGCAPLARFCDVFCDRGVFSVEEARRIFETGQALGLQSRVHADQIDGIGASELAAEIGACSADHLDHVTPAAMMTLANAGTAAVLLPGVSFSLRTSHPPAREIWDAGVTVAIATDCNPGTSYITSMPFVIALAVLEMRLTPDEAVWAATLGGARALDLTDRGILIPGARADIAVLDADSHLHLAYRPDAQLVSAVYRNGRRVV